MKLVLASSLAVSGLILFMVIQDVGSHSSTKIRGYGRGKSRCCGGRGKIFGIGKTNSKSSAKQFISKAGAVLGVVGGVMEIKSVIVSSF